MKNRDFTIQPHHKLWISIGAILLFIWWNGFKELSNSSPEKYHVAHQNAKKLVIDTLAQFDLKPSLLSFGVYPLLGQQFNQQATFPLLSTPCPIVQGCNPLISKLKIKLLQQGYRLINSVEMIDKERPIHYAIAQQDKPVMALRFVPSVPYTNLALSITQYTQVDIQSLLQLNSHVCFVIDQKSNVGRKAYDHLSLAGRELYLQVKVPEIYLSPSQPILEESDEFLYEPWFEDLKKTLHDRPYFKGVWVPSEDLSQLSKESLSQLMLFLNQHRLILLTTHTNQNSLLRSLAQVYEVRLLILSQHLQTQSLSQALLKLDSMLMMDGTGSALIPLTHTQDLQFFSQWLQKLKKISKLFRISEISL